jgi:hypothetical protein
MWPEKWKVYRDQDPKLFRDLIIYEKIVFWTFLILGLAGLVVA